jgi:hypothetical protein
VVFLLVFVFAYDRVLTSGSLRSNAPAPLVAALWGVVGHQLIVGVLAVTVAEVSDVFALLVVLNDRVEFSEDGLVDLLLAQQQVHVDRRLNPLHLPLEVEVLLGEPSFFGLLPHVGT